MARGGGRRGKRLKRLVRLRESGDQALTWDCGACRKEGLDVVRGCGPNTTAEPGYSHVTVLGQVFERCPKAWARDDAHAEAELLRQADALERWGVLPVAGGLDDQPAAFVDALDVISDAQTQARLALQRAQEARSRRG